jgi:hypothetical protein
LSKNAIFAMLAIEKMKLTHLFIIVYFTIASCSFAQVANHDGFTYFTKYNAQLISPEKSRKHVISIGTGVHVFTNEMSDRFTSITDGYINQTVPFVRVSLGYHYLFLKQKKLTFFSKKRYEFSGFSIYANAYGAQLSKSTYTSTDFLADSFNLNQNELIIPHYELRFTYTNPFMSYRGKALNFYLLHEFGLSVFQSTRNPILNSNSRETEIYVNLVPLSLKLGKRPIFFKTTVNLARSNNLLQLQKIKGSIGLEFQIYFYKTEKK